VRRIHVIGGPGSGKTTLARQLAARVSAPVFDLDEVAYVGGAGPERPLAQRLADVAAIAAQPAWVTEGIYLRWIDDLLRAADAVVWLDVPGRVAVWRIVLRHARASIAGTNRHPGLGKLIRFLRSTHRYYTDTSPGAPALSRAQTARDLAPYRSKLVRCATSREAAAFLAATKTVPSFDADPP
jgi:RecA/RadA recombinase